MAAYKHKMKTVIIPYGNASDVEELDDAVKQNVTFVPVKTIDSVLELALKKEEDIDVEQQKKKNNTVIPSTNEANRTGVFN